MLLGIYADPHITKNMRSLQDIWESSALKSINIMYDKFDELEVEAVVCLGDFFDAPRIEAKSKDLLIPILDTIESRTYPTYMLLGNHEMDSIDSNILEFFSMYENIIPITKTNDIEGMVFIPYADDPQLYNMKDKIVFTHHDIYGSALASGKTKAFFGLDPSVFKEAKLVMNGHVHLKSKPSNNIMNVGSLLISQQGELKLGDYPSFYTLDTKTIEVNEYYNRDSMIYLTIDEKEVQYVSKYDPEYLVLKVEYEGEIPETFIGAAHISWRKKISSIEDNREEILSAYSFDMKNYLIEYIKKDSEVPDNKKEEYITTGLEVLG